MRWQEQIISAHPQAGGGALQDLSDSMAEKRGFIDLGLRALPVFARVLAGAILKAGRPPDPWPRGTCREQGDATLSIAENVHLSNDIALIFLLPIL